VDEGKLPDEPCAPDACSSGIDVKGIDVKPDWLAAVLPLSRESISTAPKKSVQFHETVQIKKSACRAQYNTTLFAHRSSSILFMNRAEYSLRQSRGGVLRRCGDTGASHASQRSAVADSTTCRKGLGPLNLVLSGSLTPQAKAGRARDQRRTFLVKVEAQNNKLGARVVQRCNSGYPVIIGHTFGRLAFRLACQESGWKWKALCSMRHNRDDSPWELT
jgi:hypothetical protein